MKKTTKKARPLRAAQRPARTPARTATTTALVRVAKEIEAGVKQLSRQTGAATPFELELVAEHGRRISGEDVVLGELGLVELKLTPEEEKVLAEPVPIAEVRMLPTGQPYLGHTSYTRWFNRAFGRLGWAIVQVGRPQKAGNLVLLPYQLYVHQKPVAMAYGKQEFFEGNRDQDYGDAIESTVANALRKFAKRLGVGLELWEPEFRHEFLAAHCIRVKVKAPKDEKPRAMWRRKIDPPLAWELGRALEQDIERGDVEPAQQRAPRRAAPTERPPAPHANSDDLITQPQRQRLVLIIRNSGRDETAVAAWLHQRYKVDSLKQITRRHYDAICSAIESPADLPA